MEKLFNENEKKPKVGIRLLREELFKLIFSVELVEPTGDHLKEAVKLYLENNEEMTSKWSKENKEFFLQYVDGIADNYEFIKETIVNCVENWDFNRISTVERSLLRIATYELLILNKPIEIVANEAVELAKEYGEEKSYEFVNGVLAKIKKAKC